MSDSHAALLLVAVHLPQLVPGFGTVLLKMPRPDPSAGFFFNSAGWTNFSADIRIDRIFVATTKCG